MRGGGFAGPALLAAFAASGLAVVLAAPGSPSPGMRAPSDAPRAAAASGRTPAENEAVRAAAALGLRPAIDLDAHLSEGREDLLLLYGDYRPYFVRGDLNSDGRLDFAQAFVRRDGPEPLFDVAVFFGEAGGFSSPTWVERGLPLSAGDLSVDRSVLVVTEDVDRELSRRWRWDPGAGRFVDVDAGSAEEEDEESLIGPDGRPRTTA